MSAGSATASGLATGAGLASATVARRRVVAAVNCMLVVFEVDLQACLEMESCKGGNELELGFYRLMSRLRVTG